ncbi:MAG: DUF262 domain-containing protein [Nanoarchaeota archaeon]|nr:DUF262 domain-containing protein [Nanoarchaeota archaeon]
MTLQEEIENKLKDIKTVSYDMSIGELISLYEKEELDIHPEFQRFFRWTQLQKTKLIESLLLGIPIPPIFVSQREDGVWDVIDGLQRLSTIFGFIGILEEENGEIMSPTPLLKTDYLPSLENKKWEEQPDSGNSLISSQRLIIKRAKIGIIIIKEETGAEMKYELFQRLNTLGSRLSSQEVRNCLMVMIDRDFFYWIKNLSEYEPFVTCLSLPDKMVEEQENLELVLKFFIFKNIDIREVSKMNDLSDFITKKMREFCKNPDFDRQKEEEIFKKTFDKLLISLGEESFKRYYSDKDTFKGKFLISVFESLAVGIGTNIDLWDDEENFIEKIRLKTKSLWSNQIFISNSGSGSNVRGRALKTVPLGKELFKP